MNNRVLSALSHGILIGIVAVIMQKYIFFGVHPLIVGISVGLGIATIKIAWQIISTRIRAQ